MELINLIILFFIYSFIGWFIEVLEGVINRKDLVNRGFLIGPLCPIYGFGAIIMIKILTKYQNNYLLVFLLGALICSLLEYFASLILEKIFNTRWWDYRDKKIHINGRICLEVMILFGIGSLVLMGIMNPIVSKVLLLPDKVKIIMCIVMIVLFLIDITFTIKVIIDMKKENLIENKDITKTLNKRVKEKVKDKYLVKRLLNSFPLLKSKTRH